MSNRQAFEALKYALRQSRDGIVVSFVIHPNDLQPELMALPVGSRLMIGWEEIAEKPPASEQEPPQAQKPKRERTLAEQCAIRCADERFQTWLANCYPSAWEASANGRPDLNAAERAARVVRAMCGVSSRSEITAENADNARRWISLYGDFRDWQAQQDYGAMAR